VISYVLSSYPSYRLNAITYPVVAAAPNRITVVARPRGGDWLGDDLNLLSREGIDILVSMLTDVEKGELELEREAHECEIQGIHFVNLPIPDRSVPADKVAFLRNVDQLAELVQKGRSLGVHCRASIGRSSLLAVALLVRLGWDATQAFDMVESARGCSIPDTPEQRQWVVSNIPVGR